MWLALHIRCFCSSTLEDICCDTFEFSSIKVNSTETVFNNMNCVAETKAAGKPSYRIAYVTDSLNCSPSKIKGLRVWPPELKNDETFLSLHSKRVDIVPISFIFQSFMLIKKSFGLEKIELSCSFSSFSFKVAYNEPILQRILMNWYFLGMLRQSLLIPFYILQTKDFKTR